MTNQMKIGIGIIWMESNTFKHIHNNQDDQLIVCKVMCALV